MNESQASEFDRAEVDLVEEEGVLDLDEAKEVIPYTYEMTAYGADYPVDALVNRLRSGDIRIPTFRWQDPDEEGRVGFQRDYVWSKPQADKFIESLLLGLPVPGIFLVKQPSGVLLVLDGHQRLKTLRSFYDGLFEGREYRLNKVQERFSGRTYADLEPEDRRRLDDSIIHATVVRQDQPAGDDSSIYQIFERLNSGGTVLQPQEIRIALYHGPFVKLLGELNELEDWRALFGNRSKRLKDMELILRSLALFFYGDNYKRPMKSFLTNYMAANRDLERQDEAEIRPRFEMATRVIRNHLGERAFKPKAAVNAAVLDSLLVAMMRRLDKGPILNTAELQTAYRTLMEDGEYLTATSRATADEEQVRTRMTKATNALLGVS